MPRDPAPRELRIEELAELAQTSVRNIRVYQEKGLIRPPARRGRTAWYGPEHLSRLRRITSLLERGYTFATMEEIFTAESLGLSVSEMIAAGSAEDMRRLPGARKTIPIDELSRAFSIDLSPEFFRLCQESGLLRLDESEGVVDIDVASVRMLSVLAELGLDMDDLGSLLERMQDLSRDVAAASGELVDRVIEVRADSPPYTRTREDMEVIAVVGTKLLRRMCVHLVSEMLDARLHE